jgi:hypothetical protein
MAKQAKPTPRGISPSIHLEYKSANQLLGPVTKPAAPGATMDDLQSLQSVGTLEKGYWCLSLARLANRGWAIKVEAFGLKRGEKLWCWRQMGRFDNKRIWQKVAGGSAPLQSAVIESRSLVLV